MHLKFLRGAANRLAYYRLLAMPGVYLGEGVSLRGTPKFRLPISASITVGMNVELATSADGRRVRIECLSRDAAIKVSAGSKLTGSTLRTRSSIKIGSLCRIGPGCEIGETAANGTATGHILIGNHVEIGAGARILPGSKIGNGVQIAPGSIVQGDVPDGACISGNHVHQTARATAAKAVAKRPGYAPERRPVSA